MPAATEAFSELMFPFKGRDTTKSAFSFTRRPTPLPSEPITRAVGPVKSVWHQGEPSMSAA